MRKIPRSALRIAQSIEWGSAPWGASFWRGQRAGITELRYEWRQELFAPPGGRWQDYRTPDEIERAKAADARCAARALAQQEARKRTRLLAGRKAAQTRRERAQAAAVATTDRVPPPAMLTPSRGRRPAPSPLAGHRLGDAPILAELLHPGARYVA